MTYRRPTLLPAIAALAVLLSGPFAWAHVKWFSKSIHRQDNPLPLGEILNPTFFALSALSVVVVIGFTVLDDKLHTQAIYTRWRDLLIEREDRGSVVLRIATGMSLLLSWQSDVILAPDLGHDMALVSWVQFAAILFLIERRTTPIAGVLVGVLYAVAVSIFGVFHMLDYVAFVGVGFYLAFHESKREQLRAWVKPILFGTTGLSLAWLALEKLVFPTWGLAVLEENPMLALGLPPKFFLMSAAFVEFALGYLLLLGVLGRPLALIITLVFFLTTMVFGKHEVVGHLILHGVLIVFLLEGTSGKIAPPFRLHERLPLRIAFVGVNFVVLLGALLVGYQRFADPRFVAPLAATEHEATAPADGSDAPTVAVRATARDDGSWTLDLDVTNFRITPMGQAAGVTHPDPREGHAHLFVDGEMKEMIFATPHHLSPLVEGTHTIMVQLSTPDHRMLTVGGAPVQATVEVVQR